MPICRGVTGATGLEPATSGVTGRAGKNDGERRITSNGDALSAQVLASPGTYYLQGGNCVRASCGPHAHEGAKGL